MSSTSPPAARPQPPSSKTASRFSMPVTGRRWSCWTSSRPWWPASMTAHPTRRRGRPPAELVGSSRRPRASTTRTRSGTSSRSCRTATIRRSCRPCSGCSRIIIGWTSTGVDSGPVARRHRRRPGRSRPRGAARGRGDLHRALERAHRARESCIYPQARQRMPSAERQQWGEDGQAPPRPLRQRRQALPGSDSSRTAARSSVRCWLLLTLAHRSHRLRHLGRIGIPIGLEFGRIEILDRAAGLPAITWRSVGVGGDLGRRGAQLPDRVVGRSGRNDQCRPLGESDRVAERQAGI